MNEVALEKIINGELNAMSALKDSAAKKKGNNKQMNIIKQTGGINIYLISKKLMNSDVQNISTDKNASFIKP